MRLILPKRTRLSQAQIQARTDGTEHLLYASHDINNWSKTICSAPPDEPYVHHYLIYKCKRSGIEQPFKIGPDFIDPKFHEYATKNKSYNLDAFLLGEELVRELFYEKAVVKISHW